MEQAEAAADEEVEAAAPEEKPPPPAVAVAPPPAAPKPPPVQELSFAGDWAEVADGAEVDICLFALLNEVAEQADADVSARTQPPACAADFCRHLRRAEGRRRRVDACAGGGGGEGGGAKGGVRSVWAGAHDGPALRVPTLLLPRCVALGHLTSPRFALRVRLRLAAERSLQHFCLCT